MDEQNQNIPAENTSGSKNRLYITIGIIILVLVAIFMFSSKKTIAPGVKVDEKLNGDVTYTSEDGSITVGNSLPKNWPKDVPNYPNAVIQYSGLVNEQDGENGVTVNFMTKDNAQSVATFYNKELQNAGWSLTQLSSMGEASVISGTKDNRSLGIFISRSDDGQTVAVVSVYLAK